jgi:hypothetical protein
MFFDPSIKSPHKHFTKGKFTLFKLILSQDFFEQNKMGQITNINYSIFNLNELLHIYSIIYNLLYCKLKYYKTILMHPYSLCSL